MEILMDRKVHGYFLYEKIIHLCQFSLHFSPILGKVSLAHKRNADIKRRLTDD